MIDLTPKHLEMIQRILAEHVPKCEVRAFGSRVKRTAKDYSDLDLAVVGSESLSRRQLRRLKEAFEESDVPIRVDVVDWQSLSDWFKQVIAAEYKVIQKAEPVKGGGQPEGICGKLDSTDRQFVIFEELFDIPLRNGLTRPRAVRGSGVKMVNMGELFAYSRIGDIPMERVPLSEVEAEKYLLKKGDLLFARQSLVYSGAGKCSIFLGASEPITYEGHLIRARLNPAIADPAFYFYFFNSRLGRQVIESIIEQVAAAGIRGSDLAKLSVPYLPIQKQRQIAQILGTFDEKIELNRQMNETLEAIAGTIFKSWFVEFDPVQAKMEGRLPTGMDAATTTLFPSAFQDSLLGKIPKGWEVATVGEEFNLTMGQSPPGSTYNEAGDGLPFYQGRKDFGFRYPTRRVYCNAPTRMAKKDDTLVSVRAPVGDINMVEEKCCIGRGVAAIRHKTRSRSYTYYAMQFLREDFALYEAEGTVFGAINKTGFQTLSQLRPSDGIIEAFERLVYPLDQSIENNENQSRTLSQIRDALLPKLLSGEIRVDDVDKKLEVKDGGTS